MIESGSKIAAIAAIKMAITTSRQEENLLKKTFLEEYGLKAVAVDYGGEFINSAGKIVERAVVAAKREGVIKDTHAYEGAVAGAAREAIAQIMTKALGLNIGGKIGITHYRDHVSVAVFMGIGLLYLDEVGIGLGHRAVS